MQKVIRGKPAECVKGGQKPKGSEGGCLVYIIIVYQRGSLKVMIGDVSGMFRKQQRPVWRVRRIWRTKTL